MKALAWGPDSCATKWNMYFFNGYKFHTKTWGEDKRTINCSVHIKGVTDNGQDDFYGVIQHIYELKYIEITKKIPLFYCEWFDPRMDVGTRVNPTYNLV